MTTPDGKEQKVAAKEMYPCGHVDCPGPTVWTDGVLKCLFCGWTVSLPREEIEEEIRRMRNQEMFDDHYAATWLGLVE